MLAFLQCPRLPVRTAKSLLSRMQTKNTSLPASGPSDTPSTPRLMWILILTGVAIGTLFLVATIYLPLGVDGAWSAYPAFTLAHGRQALEYTRDLRSLRSIQGLAIKRPFDDRTIRLFPLAGWFKAFGSSLLSSRVYSLLEYFLVLVSMYLFFLTLGAPVPIAILVLAFVALDSSLLGSIADLRPDLLLMGIALLGFNCFWRFRQTQRPGWFLLSLVTLSALALLWWHSPLWIAVIGSYFLFRRLWIEKAFPLKTTAPEFLLVLIPLTVYFLKPAFNDAVFGTFPEGSVERSQVVLALSSLGLGSLIAKDVSRWREYFLVSGVLHLVVFSASTAYALWRIARGRSHFTLQALPVACALFAGVVLLFLVDPHRTMPHAFVAMPFFYGLLVLALKDQGAATLRMFPMVVALAAVLSISSSLHIAWNYNAAGYTNHVVAASLDRLMPGPSQGIDVIGPTALFPHMKPRGRVTMLDDRKASLLDQVDPRDLDYLLIDKEYVMYGFERKFRESFPDLSIETVQTIGDPTRSAYLKILAVERPR